MRNRNMGMPEKRAERLSEIPPFSPSDTLKSLVRATRLMAISRIDRKLPVGIEVNHRYYEVIVVKNREGTHVNIEDDSISPSLGQHTTVDISRNSGDGRLIVRAESYYYDGLTNLESDFYDSNVPETQNTMSLSEVLHKLRFVARTTGS